MTSTRSKSKNYYNQIKGESSTIRCGQDESNVLWGNDVILREISSYLSTTDLKRLSYVNKYLRDRVRTLHHFTACASQKVTGEMEIHVFKLSRAIVEVDKLNRDTLSILAETIFQETEHLELQGLDKLSDTEINSLPITILSNCQQLKSLKLGTINTLKDETTSFFRNENVRTRLTNLRELQIGPTSLSDHLQLHTFIFKQISITDGLLGHELFEEITKNMKLVKLNYTEPGVSRNCLHPALLLNNSRETLTELNLAIDFKDLESLHLMKFPRLSKLKLIAIRWMDEFFNLSKILRTENFPELVLQFLRNHLSNLIEFQFGSSYCLSLDPLFELLKQPRYTEKLKVLSFMHRNGIDTPTMNWDFMRTISNLRYFDLTCLNEYMRPDDLGDLGCFLTMMPDNIKSIKFRGFNFGTRHENLQNISDTQYSGLLRFKNLAELKIHCPYVLTDQLLQFICKNLTQLKILEGDFSEVTRCGISGVNTDENINTGISLANLKDLVELEIGTSANWFRFSTGELINAVCYPHLVKLTLKIEKFENTMEICAVRLLQLLNQNPSLEVFNFWPIPWSIRNGVSKILKTPTLS